MRSSIVRYAVLLALLLASCGQAERTPMSPTRQVATLFPTLATLATRPPEAAPDRDWEPGPYGIALRHMRVEEPGQPAARATIVRIDPSAVRLRVAYAPDRPRSIRAWFEEQRPLLAVNGGFFTEHYASAALLISDGVASGLSYEGFGGMLAVAPDGSLSLRALRDQPYDPAEPLDQALQSFPMLVLPGGALADIHDDGQRARRTAVALDRDGNVLLIVVPGGILTLRGFADWLRHSDLAIERALNLDGGSSTGLYLQAGPLHEAIDSFGQLPIVLLVEPG